ncbi:aminotransferase class V-fold PLP-dependent enzyme [Erythrobacter mangrovi]|uniref:Aminotransferase class V-fold PLP-dependent enzyme n=1 Tax=Erythrobacter mangrovi TaxID=2739433 RepID=A0A7D3XTK1_9SPHN|nr:aminotransferase class V-fold PLP-dependent enzyme [Erythrobacter mangrovi]QKG70156.1 aminotransferase class V-fold PLP-dependent enzyme [Erythrobacter mangrovi]
MDIDRRTLLGATALPFMPGVLSTAASAGDWASIAGEYAVTRDVIQLEHGNWGMMPQPVLQAYRAMIERVNRDTSYYARRGMAGDLEAVRAQVADAMEVAIEEIVLTRNATEALKALILQYNHLQSGDAVLYADLDYDSMQASMDALAATRGVRVSKIALPEPATHQNLLDAYQTAFDADPGIRMVLLTHVSHRTGLVLPVAEIATMARQRGIDAIVDAAHSVGQLDFRLPDLKADFIGMNLHKWIGAPLGVGALYIRKERIEAIDPDPAESPTRTDIVARVHTGTVDYAAQLTVPAALAFQAAIGGPRREARLKQLRDHWVRPLRDTPQIQILTPDDPGLYGAITSFRLRGRATHDENVALARTLLERHRIFTVHRDGLASGSCVRVTPALATHESELDRLVEAIRELAS